MRESGSLPILFIRVLARLRRMRRSIPATPCADKLYIVHLGHIASFPRYGANPLSCLLTPGTGNRGPILAPGTLYPGSINRNCFCKGGRENRNCRHNQNHTNQRDDGGLHSHIRSSRSKFSFIKGRRPGRERGFPIREVSSGTERGTHGR